MSPTGTKDDTAPLEGRLASLEARLTRIEALLGVPLPARNAEPEASVQGPAQDVSEDVLEWVGKAAILPRISALSFVLVVALLLRSLAQKGVLEPHAGALSGIAYAFFLMIAGWFCYERRHVLAPVFAVSGALLLSGIVVETHERFHTLSSQAAYVSLAATALLMAFIGKRFSAALPIIAGVFGMCISAAVIDYPNPFFPHVILLLGAANIIGYIASTEARCAWLQALLLVVTQFIFILWAVKAGQASLQGRPDQTLPWFFPEAAFLSMLYPLLALAGIIRPGTPGPSFFSYVMPAAGVILSFPPVVYVVFATGQPLIVAAMAGIAEAVFIAGIGFSLVRVQHKGAPGLTAFMLAAVSSFALAVPLVVPRGDFLAAAFAVCSLMVFILSVSWKSGGIRLLSYGFQLTSAAVFAAWLHRGGVSVTRADMMCAVVMTAAAAGHYFYVRRIPPPVEGRYFSRLDPGDVAGTGVFVAEVVFVALAIKVAALLFSPSPNQLMGIETVAANAIAAAALIGGFLLHDVRLRNVAIFLSIVCGGKVFLHDLFRMHGMPLVFGMLSFGLLVALESFLLSRWNLDTRGH